MTTLTISHTPNEGTLVGGDPRPHHQVVKDAGFRYSRNVGWYLQHSRFKPPQKARIEQLAGRLRDVGFTVEVTIDDSTVDVAVREAIIAERSADRVEHLEERAERKAADADALFERTHQMMSVIPFGQPILVGHHSERRDRNYRDKIDRTMGRAVETHRDAKETARRADAAESHQAHRENPAVTLRRIERLEAEQRDIRRKLTPCGASGVRMKAEAAGTTITCPRCFNPFTIGDDLLFPKHGDGSEHPEWVERLTARDQAITDEVAYWRERVAEAADAGFKLWGPDDFVVGDRVNGDCTVTRVNKKSLTVVPDSFAYANVKWTLAYNKIKRKG